MRCFCCDKDLTDNEVKYIPETESFEMCSVCLEIALDAAYSNGFVRPGEAEGVPILEDDPIDQNPQSTHYLEPLC